MNFLFEFSFFHPQYGAIGSGQGAIQQDQSGAVAGSEWSLSACLVTGVHAEYPVMSR